ncbi:MAG TPA: c-type cytochrome [Chitinophagaceae bacterium]|nr:c-type cytochrome [Chitinophagaceae bacterium]
MKISKKLGVLAILGIVVAISMAATKPPGYKNLKVLSKKISHEDLGRVMGMFKDGLGVKCDFCHAKSKDDDKRLDFASDEKPEKEIARKMMKMTNRINKKFFHSSSRIGQENAQLEVTCITCHHGSPHPEMPGGGEGMKH